MLRPTIALTCALTLVPGIAHAGEVSNEFFLSYTDPANVINNLQLLDTGNGLARFAEAGITTANNAGNECVDNGNVVDCPTFDQEVIIAMAGGNDTFSATIDLAAINITGGSGDDTLSTDDGDDRIGGGIGSDTAVGNGGDDVFRDSTGFLTVQAASGNDTFSGGAGNDRMEMGADGTEDAAGSDTFDGGTGSDLADYSQRTAALTITVGAGANDGAAGEADNIVAADTIRTGTGNDVITLAAGAAGRIEAGAGNDKLVGSNAADVLVGSGPDQAPGSGDDVLDGRGGADDLRGGDGVDTVDYASRTAAVSVTADGVANDGEAGENDLVQGDIESVIGGAGDDVIAMRDGRAGTITCGAGTDSVVVDDTDTVAADCETVSRPFPAPLPAPTPSPVPTPGPGSGGTGTGTPVPAIVPQLALPTGTLRLSKGRVLLATSCPKGASGACAGTLSLTTVRRGRTKARSLGRVTVALAPGKAKRYAFRPSKALARTLRRARRSSVTVRFATVSPGARTVSVRRTLRA